MCAAAAAVGLAVPAPVPAAAPAAPAPPAFDGAGEEGLCLLKQEEMEEKGSLSCMYMFCFFVAFFTYPHEKSREKKSLSRTHFPS